MKPTAPSGRPRAFAPRRNCAGGTAVSDRLDQTIQTGERRQRFTTNNQNQGGGLPIIIERHGRRPGTSSATDSRDKRGQSRTTCPLQKGHVPHGRHWPRQCDAGRRRIGSRGVGLVVEAELTRVRHTLDLAARGREHGAEDTADSAFAQRFDSLGPDQIGEQRTTMVDRPYCNRIVAHAQSVPVRQNCHK